MKRLKEKIKNYLKKRWFPDLNINEKALIEINMFYSYLYSRTGYARPEELHKLLSVGDPVKLFIQSTKYCRQGGRRIGNTTRVVDLAIQFFFLYGEMKSEWFIYEESRRMQEHAFEIFSRRLVTEHKIDQIISRDMYIINRRNHIKLRKH